jgi:hypothetical protein
MSHEVSHGANDTRWSYLPTYIYESSHSGMPEHYVSIRDEELSQVNGLNTKFYPYIFQSRVVQLDDCPAYFLALQSANHHRHLLVFVNHNANTKRTHYRFVSEDFARSLSPHFGEAIDSLDSIEGLIIMRVENTKAITFDDDTPAMVDPNHALREESKALFFRSFPLTHFSIPSS